MKRPSRTIMFEAMKMTGLCMVALAIPSVIAFGWPGLLIPIANGILTLAVVAVVVSAFPD